MPLSDLPPKPFARGPGEPDSTSGSAGTRGDAGSEIGVPSAPTGHRLRGRDRREQPTPRLSKYTLFGGRRRDVRRPDEREGSYVDVYGTPIVLAALWIAMMNIADSFFTLHHLQAGGIELNPVADQLLKTGRTGFVFWKSALIGVALLVLILHKNFNLARIGLWIAAASYTTLVGYHLVLL